MKAAETSAEPGGLSKPLFKAGLHTHKVEFEGIRIRVVRERYRWAVAALDVVADSPIPDQGLSRSSGAEPPSGAGHRAPPPA
jgi:hypothetical protein